MTADEHFAIELGRANRQWRKRLDDRLKHTGLTQARWLVLLHLSRAGPLSQRELAATVGIEGPTLVRLLDSLERRGLIERRVGKEDRRVRRVFLTTQAHPLLAEITAIAVSLRREVLAGIDDSELRVAWKVLRVVADQLESL